MKYYVLSILLFLSGCKSTFERFEFIPQDSALEERAESFIEERGGIFIDFSPQTPEESYGNK